jgi:hypothetical protein
LNKLSLNVLSGIKVRWETSAGEESEKMMKIYWRQRRGRRRMKEGKWKSYFAVPTIKKCSEGSRRKNANRNYKKLTL